MKRNLYFILVLLQALILPGRVSAQEAAAIQDSLKYSHSISISSPSTVSTDRNGHVYFLDAKRNLVKVDSSGRAALTYSPAKGGRITSIDAWNPMKVLLFYEDRQEIVLLDRFLRPITSTAFSDYDALTGSIKAAALASDDGFWLFNESNYTLSKLDTRLRRTVAETSLNLILDKARFDVRMLREYQNTVYLLDYNTGILVFDNLGNYKKTIPITGISQMGFRGNELYFVKDGKLNFLDIYTQKQHSIALPSTAKYTSAIVSSNRVYLFTMQQMQVYTWQ